MTTAATTTSAPPVATARRRTRAARIAQVVLRPSMAFAASAFVAAGLGLAALLMVAGPLAGHLGLPALGGRLLTSLTVVATAVTALAAAVLSYGLVPLIRQSRARLRTMRGQLLVWRMRALLRPRIAPGGVRAGEIAAATLAGDEDGADYYDLIPDRGGCWIAVGEIGGASLESGLVFVMIQSALNALVQYRSRLPPEEILRLLRDVLRENVRGRLGVGTSARLSLAHVTADGEVLYAGTPERLDIFRAADASWETIASGGAAALAPGDLLVLHTNRLVTATDSSGRPWGKERLRAEVVRACHLAPHVICSAIEQQAGAWAASRPGGGSLVVLRYRASS
jgi:hypothetical protein